MKNKEKFLPKKVKIRYKKTGKVTEVSPLNAKEILATGGYELAEQPKKVVEKKAVEKVVDINSMNTKDIDAYVEENFKDVVIEGYDKMKLVDKRLAVLELIENQDEDDDEGEDI